jgi:hypothetical protein
MKRYDPSAAAFGMGYAARRLLTGFSLVPMLLGESISPETRQASREHRLKDAGELLIQEYGLTCGEVSDLLDVSMC